MRSMNRNMVIVLGSAACLVLAIGAPSLPGYPGMAKPTQVDREEATDTTSPTGAEKAQTGAEPRKESVASTPLQEAQNDAGKRGRYLVAVFYDSDNPEDLATRDQLSRVVEEEHKDRMEIFEVDITRPEHGATVQEMGILRTPMVLVFAPSGAVTQHFDESADVSASLSKAVLSPKLEEVLAGIQQRKVVFVHVSDPQGESDRENRRVLDGVTGMLPTSTRVVYVQADAPEEQVFLRDILGADPLAQTPVTVVVSQDGGIAEKIPGALTRQRLLSAFRNVLVSRSGCGGMGSGPGGQTCD